MYILWAFLSVNVRANQGASRDTGHRTKTHKARVKQNRENLTDGQHGPH